MGVIGCLLYIVEALLHQCLRQNAFLFQGGYQQQDKFYFLTAHGGRLVQRWEAIPICDGSKVAVEQCSLLSSRMLFLGKNGILYGGVLGGDGL